MPFKSKAQNAWAHTPKGTKALGGAKAVKEWEGATDYSALPKKVKPTTVVPATEATPVQGYETVDTVDRSLPLDSPERARRANNQARDMRTNLGRGKSTHVEV